MHRTTGRIKKDYGHPDTVFSGAGWHALSFELFEGVAGRNARPSKTQGVPANRLDRAMAESLKQYLQDKQARVDKALRSALALGEGCPAALSEAMAYSLFAPCKRLRPLLVIMAAEACAGPVEEALPAACAVE